MTSRTTDALRHMAIALAFGCLADTQALGQATAAAGSAPAAPSPFRVVRSISGSRTEIKGGRFLVLDPRTSFRIPEDTRVVVYFEWLGPAGKHQLAGTWRGPANTSATSTFEHVAKDTSFSAYWELTLPATLPRGPWTLTATIDGLPAGEHAFEIAGMDAPAPAPVAVRTPLTRQELFARTLKSSVTVEVLDASGGRLAIGPGAVVDASTVATSFTLINNAARIRVRGAEGPPVDSSSVVAWNRRQDWVLVRVEGLAGVNVPARAADQAQPGEACYSVGNGPEGTLSVSTGEIVGVSDLAQWGPRLSIAFFAGGGTPGAPLLNEYGEAVGMLTEGVLQQNGSLSIMRMGQLGDVPRSFALPITALPSETTAVPTPLATLAERGLFVPVVRLHRHVLSGGFATSILAKGASTQPVDQRVEFERNDSGVTTFLTWSPAERIKGTATLRLYNLDNQLLAETKPLKLSLRPSDLVLSSWSIKVPPPGVYRADVYFNAEIAWRGMFRVKE